MGALTRIFNFLLKRSSRHPMKWEYKIVHVPANLLLSKTGFPRDFGDLFNRLGSEGWELVRVEPILRAGFVFMFGSTTSALLAFFKRPIP